MWKKLSIVAFFPLALSMHGQAVISSESFTDPDPLPQGIIEKVAPESGEKIYFREEVCPFTGRVTLTEVEFSTVQKRFVPVGSGQCAPLIEIEPAEKKKITAKVKLQATHSILPRP